MTDTLLTAVQDTTGITNNVLSTGSAVDSLHRLKDTAVLHIHSFLPRLFSGEIIPEIHTRQPDHWFLYVLLALFLIVSVIWYYIPERLVSIFSLSAEKVFKKSGEKGIAGPGPAVTIFFLINSLVTTSFYIFYMLKYQISDHLFTEEMINEKMFIVYIAAALTAFSLLKLLLMRLIGVLFGTNEMAAKQQIIYFNSYNALGVILLPLLFILLTIGGEEWSYFILLVIAGMFVYRWIQTVIIGIHESRFNTFHLILYLCTLEIIPLLVLWRVFILRG